MFAKDSISRLFISEYIIISNQRLVYIFIAYNSCNAIYPPLSRALYNSILDIIVATTVSPPKLITFFHILYAYIENIITINFFTILIYSNTPIHISVKSKAYIKLFSFTYCCKFSICIDPQFMFIFVPLGTLSIT